MISDDERREVARRLREIEGRTTSELTDSELLDLLADKVRFGRYGSKNFDEGLFGRIADLIDRPICRNIADPYDGSFFECSKCGERWELTCGSPADNHLCFCPRCGAEVAS